MPGRPRDRADDTQFPSSKRPRAAHARGTITKIKLHNFMTYTDVEVIPGPRLNLVLGPNGTGKSSLVNAICLGLAGSTQLLGRADNVRDFVLRGQDEGFVQIWLSTGQPGRNLCIKRSMNIKDNSSEWRINGEPVNLKIVKDRVRELHVQLDNLCQFLPQDKVVEFAKLKPVQLLAETQKAISDSSLYTLHQELIEERNELKTKESATRGSKQELDVLERANEGLKRDVHRVEQRAQLENKVDALEDKLAWTKFRDFKNHHKENVDEYHMNEARLQNMHIREQESQQPMREKTEKKEEASKTARTALNKMKKLEEEIGTAKEKLDQQIEEADDKHGKLESLEDEYDRWQAEMKKVEQGIEQTKAELSEIPQTQATQASQSQTEQNLELRRLDAKRREITANAKAFQSQADVRREELDVANQELVAYSEQMRRLTNVKIQRLQQLESHFLGITKLTRWLESNEAKALFRGRVYGPILCEITVDTHQNAAWLEQHCPKELWGRFVTEFQEDQDKLDAESTARFSFRPIITNFSGNVAETVQHKFGDSSKYASDGIVCTLDEAFQAPHTIKLVMCNEVHLHETYCANRNVDPESFLERNPNIPRLMTPEAVYGVGRSWYNPAARCTSVNSMRPSRLIVPSGSSNVENEKAELQTKIEDVNRRVKEVREMLAGLESDISEEDKKANALQNEISKINQELSTVKNRRTLLSAKIRTDEKKLLKLRSKADPRGQAPKLQKEIEGLCREQSKLVTVLTGMHVEMLALNKENIVAETTSRELIHQIKEMHKEQDERGKNLVRLEKLMKDMKQGIEEEKEQLQTLKQAALDRTGPMSDKIKARFGSLPSRKTEIEELIRASIAEMDGIHLTNPRALDEYTQRKAQIEKMAAILKDQENHVNVQQKAIAAKKERWLPELRRIIMEIDRNFGQSFARIGCAGEVELHEERDPVTQQEDFEKFAIHIKVRFRAEEGLQLLTAHRQSGGERSVSTILYLIAIQNVTVCPFRVVDEINQGMDPVNERKVFMQLVEAACQPNTPQCFLLTPKLLPNLPFSEHVTLLEIFNGQLLSGVARNYSAAKILGGRRPITVTG